MGILNLPLETERLRIRLHREEDRQAFVALVTDPQFYEHLNIPESQRTPEGAAQVFDLVVSSYESEEPVWGYTLADRESDAFVGTLALSTIPFGDALEVFFAITPSLWGSGLASEALEAVMQELPQKAFVALTSPENERSKKVVLSAGMHDSGIQRHVGGPPRHRFSRPPTAIRELEETLDGSSIPPLPK